MGSGPHTQNPSGDQIPDQHLTRPTKPSGGSGSSSRGSSSRSKVGRSNRGSNADRKRKSSGEETRTVHLEGSKAAMGIRLVGGNAVGVFIHVVDTTSSASRWVLGLVFYKEVVIKFINRKLSQLLLIPKKSKVEQTVVTLVTMFYITCTAGGTCAHMNFFFHHPFLF